MSEQVSGSGCMYRAENVAHGACVCVSDPLVHRRPGPSLILKATIIRDLEVWDRQAFCFMLSRSELMWSVFHNYVCLSIRPLFVFVQVDFVLLYLFCV